METQVLEEALPIDLGHKEKPVPFLNVTQCNLTLPHSRICIVGKTSEVQPSILLPRPVLAIVIVSSLFLLLFRYHLSPPRSEPPEPTSFAFCHFPSGTGDQRGWLHPMHPHLIRWITSESALSNPEWPGTTLKNKKIKRVLLVSILWDDDKRAFLELVAHPHQLPLHLFIWYLHITVRYEMPAHLLDCNRITTVAQQPSLIS